MNAAVAEQLEQMASGLEQERPIPTRRIAAYRRAAAALRTTSLRVDELWRAGRDRALSEIPGVTSAISQVIGDLIATKRIPLPHPAPAGDRAKREPDAP